MLFYYVLFTNLDIFYKTKLINSNFLQQSVFRQAT